MERQPDMVPCSKCHRNLERKHMAIHETRCGGGPRGLEMVTRTKPTFVQRPLSPPPVETIPCVNCGYRMTFAELDSHPDQCEGQQSECQYCHSSYPNMLLEEHHNVCESRRETTRNRHRIRSMEEGQAVPAFMERRREGGLEHLMRALHQMRTEAGEERRDNRPNALEMLIRMFMHSENLNVGDGLSEADLKNLPKVRYEKKSEQGDLCTICYCNFEPKEEIVSLECKHLYHEECISKWLGQNPECPVCKRTVRPKKVEEDD